MSDRCDHTPAISRQSDHNAAATENQHPYRYRRLGTDDAGLSDTDNRRERADRVSHVIRAMSKRHRAGRNDHQNGKYAFDGIKMLSLFQFRIRLDASNQERADKRYDHRDQNSEQVSIRDADTQADVLQPFQYGH